MNSCNAKADTDVRKEKVELKTEEHDVRVLRSSFVDAPELAFEDEPDTGCDPYNSTGQHVSIKPKDDTKK